MAQVIGVRLNKNNKIYYYDPLKYDFAVGDGVIVETAKGTQYAWVACEKKEVCDDIIVKPLKAVTRKATKEDDRRLIDNIKKEQDASDICKQCIDKHNLDMKLINIEYSFDSNKIVFYFTADGRVDFRELVKDLASIFKMRIELRQIGVRDEAKMLGGLGPCGRPACCSEFLSDFQPVSIKMAKEQNLSLSPTKISGLCGRLMCCLNYEQELYETANKKLRRVDREVSTPDGKGVVIEVAALTEMVKVKIQLPDGTFDAREYPASDVELIPGCKKHGKCPRANREAAEGNEVNSPVEGESGTHKGDGKTRDKGDGKARDKGDGRNRDRSEGRNRDKGDSKTRDRGEGKPRDKGKPRKPSDSRHADNKPTGNRPADNMPATDNKPVDIKLTTDNKPAVPVSADVTNDAGGSNENQ